MATEGIYHAPPHIHLDAHVKPDLRPSSFDDGEATQYTLHLGDLTIFFKSLDTMIYLADQMRTFAVNVLPEEAQREER